MALNEADFWAVVQAERMSVIIDAEDFFRLARSAMLKAKRRIMLVGWDFDGGIELVSEGREEGEPAAVGGFLRWLVDRAPELEVFLLRWDVGAVKTVFRGTNLFTLAAWMRNPRIHTKLDSFHPTGASHHQKIIVIDDCLAFCGGIDMTSERWDTRHHRDIEPGRAKLFGRQYKPWHDATSILDGPIAAKLGELGRERWHLAGGKTLEPITEVVDCWPEKLEPDFRQVHVGIARTRGEMPDCPEIREIEKLFVDQIAAAKKTIYAESQYFGSRVIAEAIAKRLGEADGPEIVIVTPQTAEGWLEPLAMDTARARLVAKLRQCDKHGRFRVYHPFTEQGQPIYCHAKIMIVDGRLLRIGSANMNNRSMGLDTECDVAIEAGEGEVAVVRNIRDGLLAEHLGVETERIAREIDERGSLIDAIESLLGPGRSLRPYTVPKLSDVEKWLADNEVLDAEHADEVLEPMSGGRLKSFLNRPAA